MFLSVPLKGLKKRQGEGTSEEHAHPMIVQID